MCSTQIARSDGTRASVDAGAADHEDRRRADLGRVRFDKDGDVEPSPFAIVRFERMMTLNGVTADGQTSWP